jgi:RNase P subunit RPR2
MRDRFTEKMADAKARSDTRLLGDFTRIYCRGNHRGASRHLLTSPGAEIGVYGRRSPTVCDECAELLRYAEKRRAFCPKDPKPFCSHCDTHCYTADMRERVRVVMRYAGPRSMFSRHAVAGVKHLLEGRRAKAAAREKEQVQG